MYARELKCYLGDSSTPLVDFNYGRNFNDYIVLYTGKQSNFAFLENVIG